MGSHEIVPFIFMAQYCKMPLKVAATNLIAFILHFVDQCAGNNPQIFTPRLGATNTPSFIKGTIPWTERT